MSQHLCGKKHKAALQVLTKEQRYLLEKKTRAQMSSSKLFSGLPTMPPKPFQKIPVKILLKPSANPWGSPQTQSVENSLKSSPKQIYSPNFNPFESPCIGEEKGLLDVEGENFFLDGEKPKSNRLRGQNILRDNLPLQRIKNVQKNNFQNKIVTSSLLQNDGKNLLVIIETQRKELKDKDNEIRKLKQMLAQAELSLSELDNIMSQQFQLSRAVFRRNKICKNGNFQQEGETGTM